MAARKLMPMQDHIATGVPALSAKILKIQGETERRDKAQT
jgi:hypothetical protein